MSRVAELEAPAKVNLFLRVLDQRDDGYHEIETLFQAIDLTDHLRVERSSGGIDLEVFGANLGAPHENLAHRAAARWLSEVDPGGGVRITLNKRIPVGAGLGGGSSDAAAVLRCLAALHGPDRDDEGQRRLAAELGSDVPFFLGSSPLALGRGRGEVLEPCGPLPAAHLVLVSPPVHVSTGWAYRVLDEALRGRAAASGTAPRGRPSSWRDVIAAAHNDFQAVVSAAHPEIARSLAALDAAGAEVALMSGSGSTSFGVFASRGAAERAAEALELELGWPCRAVRTVSALPVPVLT